MAQIAKVVGQVEIKCNADKYFDVFAYNTPQLSKMCPHIHKVDLIEGNNCHTLGAVLSWTYINPLDGKYESGETKLKEIDEEKRSFTYELINGDVSNNYYKTWKDTVEISPKGENGGSIVKWSVVEYEKKSEDAPDPSVYMDFFLKCVKDIDNHLSSA